MSQCAVSCVANTCTATRTDTVVRTTTNPDGTTTVTTDTVTNPDGGNAESVTCGLPGTPPCKIDERGTPTFQTPVDVTPDLTTADQTKRTQVDQSIQPPTFGFLGAPPLASCTPFEMPAQIVGNASVQIPALNPCGVVDGVRAAMAYIWAVAAVWLALGMVRRTVTGG